MNVLVIAPHPDDETIGCGGSLDRHRLQGDHVHLVWLTSGELGLKRMPADQARQIRESEAARAQRILRWQDHAFLRCKDWSVAANLPGLAQALLPILKRQPLDRIYLPHPADDHPDHRPVLPLVQAALKSSRIPWPEIRGYEVWTALAQVDYVEDITPSMPRKMKALRCYQSQLTSFDYVRAVRGLNQFRGALLGRCSYAEAFQDLSQHP